MADTANAVTKSLRVIAVATFIPAFPLCVAHGVVSNSVVPAVGLVPLAFSSGGSIFLLVHDARRRRRLAQDDTEHNHGENVEEVPRDRQVLVFVSDVVLATALMIVLVFTWIQASHRREAMLAAYATIPLLVNFSIHLYLAVRALYMGFAMRNLMQWVAWQAVPPDCPNCNHRLRPAETPDMPWLESFPVLTDVRRWRFPAIKTPAWLKGEGGPDEQAPLLADDGRGTYMDGSDAGGESSRAMVETLPEPVEGVTVVGKKAKNGKTPPVLPRDM